MGSSARVSTNVGAALTWKRVKASGSITRHTAGLDQLAHRRQGLAHRLGLEPAQHQGGTRSAAWSTSRCRLPRGMSSVMKMRNALVPVAAGGGVVSAAPCLAIAAMSMLPAAGGVAASGAMRGIARGGWVVRRSGVGRVGP
jgi:hypothetical protein